MKIDLTQYTIGEIMELKEQCSNYVNSYIDGHDYICKVRSYGRSWFEHVYNIYSLQDLCNQYDGQDGIVDVYSTNPDLSDLHNYGDVLYIKSLEDYRKWDEYVYLKSLISDIEERLEKWNNRDNVPFSETPWFEPPFTQEDLLKYKKQLEEYDMSFTPPTKYNQHEEDN